MAGLFSKHKFLRRVAFRLGFLEVQVRRVVGMFGALFLFCQLIQRTFNLFENHAAFVSLFP